MYDVLATITELEQDGLDSDMIVAILKGRAQDDARERDRWADHESEADQRRAFEAARGERVCY